MIVIRVFQRAYVAIAFALYFIWEVFLANLRVAWEVVTMKHTMRPGILAIPLEARTNTEIALLANLISLTPGTLSMDVSSDRTHLYIHVMYVSDVEEFKRFERRLLRVLR